MEFGTTVRVPREDSKTSVPIAGIELAVVPRVPRGLAAAVEGLTREVLRHRPEDIYIFAARYFEELLKLRGVRGGESKRTNSSNVVKHADRPERNTDFRRASNDFERASITMARAFSSRKKDSLSKKTAANRSGWSVDQTAKVLRRREEGGFGVRHRGIVKGNMAMCLGKLETRSTDNTRELDDAPSRSAGLLSFRSSDLGSRMSDGGNDDHLFAPSESKILAGNKVKSKRGRQYNGNSNREESDSSNAKNLMENQEKGMRISGSGDSSRRDCWNRETNKLENRRSLLRESVVESNEIKRNRSLGQTEHQGPIDGNGNEENSEAEMTEVRKEIEKEIVKEEDAEAEEKVAEEEIRNTDESREKLNTERGTKENNCGLVPTNSYEPFGNSKGSHVASNETVDDIGTPFSGTMLPGGDQAPEKSVHLPAVRPSSSRNSERNVAQSGENEDLILPPISTETSKCLKRKDNLQLPALLQTVGNGCGQVVEERVNVDEDTFVPSAEMLVSQNLIVVQQARMVEDDITDETDNSHRRSTDIKPDMDVDLTIPKGDDAAIFNQESEETEAARFFDEDAGIGRKAEAESSRIDESFKDSLNATSDESSSELAERPDSLEPLEEEEERRRAIDDESVNVFEGNELKNKLIEIEFVEKSIERTLLDSQALTSSAVENSADEVDEKVLPGVRILSVTNFESPNTEKFGVQRTTTMMTGPDETEIDLATRKGSSGPASCEPTMPLSKRSLSPYVLTEGSPCEIPDDVVTVVIPDNRSGDKEEPIIRKLDEAGEDDEEFRYVSQAFGEYVSVENSTCANSDAAFVRKVEMDLERTVVRNDLDEIREEQELEEMEEELKDSAEGEAMSVPSADFDEATVDDKDTGRGGSEGNDTGVGNKGESTEDKEIPSERTREERTTKMMENASGYIEVRRIEEPTENSLESVSGDAGSTAGGGTSTVVSSNEAKETTATDRSGTESLSSDPERPTVPELNLDSLRDITISSFKMSETEEENLFDPLEEKDDVRVTFLDIVPLHEKTELDKDSSDAFAAEETQSRFFDFDESPEENKDHDPVRRNVTRNDSERHGFTLDDEIARELIANDLALTQRDDETDSPKMVDGSSVKATVLNDGRGVELLESTTCNFSNGQGRINGSTFNFDVQQVQGRVPDGKGENREFVLAEMQGGKDASERETKLGADGAIVPEGTVWKSDERSEKIQDFKFTPVTATPLVKKGSWHTGEFHDSLALPLFQISMKEMKDGNQECRETSFGRDSSVDAFSQFLEDYSLPCGDFRNARGYFGKPGRPAPPSVLAIENQSSRDFNSSTEDLDTRTSFNSSPPFLGFVSVIDFLCGSKSTAGEPITREGHFQLLPYLVYADHVINPHGLFPKSSNSCLKDTRVPLAFSEASKGIVSIRKIPNIDEDNEYLAEENVSSNSGTWKEYDPPGTGESGSEDDVMQGVDDKDDKETGGKEGEADGANVHEKQTR